MTRSFIEVPSFTNDWFALGFTDDDLSELENILLSNPEAGVVMQGTGGVRKIRYAFQGRGKSGSTRVCYVDFAYYESIYLLAVYSKNDKSNLSDIERHKIKRLVQLLKQECDQNRGDQDE